MGKLMKQFADELKRDPLFIDRLGKEEVELSKQEAKKRLDEALKPFIEAEKEDESFDIIFGYADDKGNLYASDESGIRVIMSVDEIKSDLEWYKAWVRDKFVGMPFTAKVAKIDKKEGIVYVKNGRGGANPERVKLIREIDRELKKGMPVVPCRVTSVKDDALYVDICGCRVLGICLVANWSKAYTRHLRDEVKPGDILEFAIDKKLPKRDGAGEVYALTRKEMTKDPWQGLPRELFKENAVIVVTCVSKVEEKGYWWGKSPLCPEIDIMANMNSKFEGGIMQGVSYKCKVREVNLDKRIFRVSPFEPVMTSTVVNAIHFKKTKAPIAV